MNSKFVIFPAIAVALFIMFVCVVALIGIVGLNFLMNSGPNFVYMNA